MKILLVTGSYPPMRCGVGDYSFRLVSALATLPNIEVAVLTTQCAPETVEQAGVDVYREVKSWKLREWRKVYQLIKRVRPDVVHIQYPTQGYTDGFLPYLIPLMAKLLGSKVVQTWHEGCSIRRLPQLFFQVIVPGALVVVRPNYRQFLSPLLRWTLWNKTPRLIRNAAIVPLVRLDAGQRDELRRRLLKGQARLIVFFGFVLPQKGAELLFDIADPETDHIVIAGELIDGNAEKCIKSCQSRDAWLGRSTVTGFLPMDEVAELLAVADAVVLPFRKGGGEWNSSIHAATMQGTFVLTTSKSVNGYQAESNVYFANIDDLPEMKTALAAYAGTRKQPAHGVVSWDEIASDHAAVYRSVEAS